MKQELLQMKAASLAWIRRVPGEDRIDHGMRLMVAAVVLLFPAACLLVDRSDSLSLLLLLVIGLTAWVRNGLKAGLTRREWACVAVFVFFFVTGLLAFELGHQTDAGFRLLGRYLRLLFVLPALVALKRHRPPPALVWAGLGLGAVALGADAAWERIAGGAGAGLLTANTDSNAAILLGDLSALLTFAFAAGYVFIDQRLPRLGPWLVGLCVLAGLLACFLSGARGGWVALPVLLVLFLTARHLLHPRAVLAGAVAIAALFAGLYFLPQAHVRERIASAVVQSRTYVGIQDSIAKLGRPLRCLDDPALLKIWAGGAIQTGSPAITVSVSELRHARQMQRRGGCTGKAALMLYNAGAAKASVRLPRYPRVDAGRAETRWVVRGTGGLKFGRGGRSLHRFHTRKYLSVDMTAPRQFSDGVTVVVPPHDHIRLVPVESFVGEYSYAVLAHASVAERLQMWSVAWDMFRKAPLLGAGTGAYMMEARERVDANMAPPVVAVYDHPHSEYLDGLSSRGLVGLLALLLFLGIPAWLFSRGLGSPDPVRMGACLAGLMLPVGFAVFGLTETMFIHSVTLGWYAIMTAVFLVTADATEGRVQ